MSGAFVLLFVASCALVAFAVSALVGVAVVVVDRVISDVNARGRNRSWLVAASLPAVASAVVVVGAFGPWVGLAPDHCGTHLASHVHLCFGHPAESASAILIFPASVLAARVSVRFLRAASDVWRARTLRRRLLAVASGEVGDVTVLPLSEPIAFVVGWLSPELFVSRALLHRPDEEVAAVLAHERAHAQRLDPLRRLASGVLLGFHLPGIADALERRLGLTQEMAADESAAFMVGDRLGVAQSLVSLTRARAAGGAVDLEASGVSARVLELLRRQDLHPGPSLRVFAGALAAFLLAITVSAGAVHHLLEHALDLLGA